MKTTLMVAATVLGACALFACAVDRAAADGPAVKSWVASTGTDSGTCQVTAPCRTFAYALGQTAAGGEIDVKDSGGYGAFSISKAVSIVAPDGVLATISAQSGTDGLSVNVDPPGVVVLHGLTFDGHLIGRVGVYADRQGTLLVEHCTFRNLSIGLYLISGFALVTDSSFSGNAVGIGIPSNVATAFLRNNVVVGNGTGIQGAFSSYGDNAINDNGTDVDSKITAVPKR